MARVHPSNLIVDARYMGLHVATHSPGDGVTRYRVFCDPYQTHPDYDAGLGLYTAHGPKDLDTFLAGFSAGKSCD